MMFFGEFSVEFYVIVVQFKVLQVLWILSAQQKVGVS